MSKENKPKINWIKLTNNPLLIGSILIIITIILIAIASSILIWFNQSANPNTKPTTITYFLKEGALDDFNNDGSLTTKTTLSPYALTGPIISSEDPSQGSENALITIVNFANFSCPFCRQQEEIFQKIIQEYPNQIRLIRKDTPDNNQQGYSYLSAKAARCAQQQNKYWKYHDQLLLVDLEESVNFEKMAIQTGLDIAVFKQCFYQNSWADTMINKNWQEAEALGVSAIPYIYINNFDFLGGVSYEELKTTIDSIIATNQP